MSEQHTPEPHKMEATVFVYRHLPSGTIKALYVEAAKAIDGDHYWEHLATLEPRMWIEHNYGAAEQRDTLIEAIKGALEESPVSREILEAALKGCAE